MRQTTLDICLSQYGLEEIRIIKRQHLDCLVLYLVGNRYVLYGRDAILVKRLLKDAVTESWSSDSNRIYVCSFPDYGLRNISRQLNDYGYDLVIATPAKGVYTTSIVTAPLMAKAKRLITDFCLDEYDSPAYFGNLRKIGIAFTTITDDEIPMQVEIDLIDLCLNQYLDSVLVDQWRYSTLQELISEELKWLSFDDLIYCTDEALAKVIDC